MNDANEEEPDVTEAHLHLTDLADLAATDRMLDRIAARVPDENADDEVAALLLALALDVDGLDDIVGTEADAELEALVATWFAEGELGEAVEESSDDTSVRPALRRPRGDGRALPWTPRRLLPTALRLGAAAAVAVVAVGIGGMVTGDGTGLSGLPGLPSMLGGSNSTADDAGDQVQSLIQQAKAAVRDGRPNDAVRLFTRAVELVPQVDASQRSTLQQALSELREVLVAAPGVPESDVPQVPQVAAGETEPSGSDQGDPASVPSPSPVLPTLDPATPTPTPEELTTEPEVTTPDPTPTEEPTSLEPTPTPEETPTSEPSPTNVDPQNQTGGGDPTSDPGEGGESVQPLATPGGDQQAPEGAGS